MSDERGVWRRAYDAVVADEVLFGRDGALKLHELERRARLAARLREMGVEPSASPTRNLRLFKVALMKQYEARSWSETEAAYCAPRAGDHAAGDWTPGSSMVRAAEMVLLTTPCWPPRSDALQPRPPSENLVAKPAVPRVVSAAVKPVAAEHGFVKKNGWACGDTMRPGQGPSQSRRPEW